LSVFTRSTFSFLHVDNVRYWLDHLLPHEAQLAKSTRHVMCRLMPRGYGTCFPFERFPALKTLLIWIYPAYVRANSLATTMQEMSHANRKDGIVVIIRDADVF
jgi:hypothetical protein